MSSLKVLTNEKRGRVREVILAEIFKEIGAGAIP
jgi:hypothetical protein